MATIIVATSSPPFVDGGHLVMARELVGALEACGHRAALLVTPQNRFGRQGAAYLAAWLTDVSLAHDGQRVDQVISLRYPAYAVRHDRQVVWLNHRMREYYDLWEQFSSGLSSQALVKERFRRAMIHRADRHLLLKAQRRFAISATVQARLQRWGGIAADVLHPPPPVRPYRNNGYGDYVFAVSRLTPLKRFDLLLQALSQTVARHVRCVIAGEGSERDALVRLSGQLGLHDRVSFVGRLDEAQLLDHYANCRGVVFPTFNEDYGFVTVEAFASGKAVITCRDSGGPAELVRDGQNGLVVDPSPEALAVALAAVSDDRALAVRLGEAGAQQVGRMSWEGAVKQLVL
jgi:glycosyltransferase involved in cell wall biosynthesis